MNFEEVSTQYERAFGEMPPALTTLDVEDKKYLDVLNQAIEDGKPLTRNDLADIFMKDDEALY